MDDKFILSIILGSFLITSLGVLIVIIIYPFLDPFFPNGIINKSYLVLIILCGGLLIYSFLIPLDFIFIQAGSPGIQSIFMSLNIIINIILNSIFIPILGLYGAALATSISLIFSSINLLILMSLLGYISRR